MKSKIKISRLFFFFIFSITLFFSCSFTGFLIWSQYREYREEVQRVQDQYIEANKLSIRNEVHAVLKFIEFTRSHGKSTDTAEESTQQQVLDWLNGLSTGKDAYIAAFSSDGVRLAFHDQSQLGSRMWDHVDPNGVKVVQECIRVAKDPDGGFAEYIASPRPSTGRPARKISYCMSVSDWNWTLCTGFYLDEIDAEVAGKKVELSRAIMKSIGFTGALFVFVTAILAHALAYVTRRFNASFQAFTSFFDRAARESVLINADKVNFEEFHKLAVSANRMIAERQEAEGALYESERRFREMLEKVKLAAVILDIDGNVIFCNDFLLELMDRRREEVVGGNWFDCCVPPEEGLKRKALFVSRIPMGKVPAHNESEICTRGGERRLIAWCNTLLRDIDGRVIGGTSIGEDITDRKRAETALRESEKRMSEMFDFLPDATFAVDSGGKVIAWNRAIEEMTGVHSEAMLGRGDQEYALPFYGKRRCLLIDLLLAPAGDAEALYAAVVRKDGNVLIAEADIPMGGRVRHLWATAAPLYDSEGKITGAIESIRDLTRTKQAEKERIRLVTAIEQAAEAIFIVDTDWTITYANPAFERISGYAKNEIVGRNTDLLQGGEGDGRGAADGIYETLVHGEVWSGRLVARRKDGSSFDAEATASPVRDIAGNIINYVNIYRDITHEVRLERDLRQAHKMEAIGTLAGGIAHDFNNILTAIIGYTELALSRAGAGEGIGHDLDQVLKAGSRAKDLVKQILTFSRQAEQERKPMQIAPTVKEALQLLRSSLPSTIEIRQTVAVSPEDGVVMADPTQIHQVLMNLCTNAAHAMRSKGGVLSVNMAETVVDDRLVTRCPELKEGPYLALTVSDTGVGMDPAIMERIFDPYFTTKKKGEGTGMGLALVRGIVRNHGGAVTVSSKPGKGTTFRVYLPKVAESVETASEGSCDLPRGRERVLFVDDEKSLAALGKEILESLGYSVTAMESSTEALDAFRARPDAFDLVVTDMTMPVMTGMELAGKLLEIRPDLPVILCTGFSELLTGNQAREGGIREVVMKPYVLTKFAETIRRVLDS